MEQQPNQEPTSYGEYRGYTPPQPTDPYSSAETPQSTYPHEGYSSEPGSSQEQYGYQQQQQQSPYGQQQQGGYQYQQQQQYQPPYSTQYTGANAGPHERSSLGMKATTAAVLSYLFGWVTGIIFLLLEKENRFVRFHAAQSIILFGILSIAQWIASIISFGSLSSGLGIVIFVCWIVMMVNAARGKYYKLPIIGDYAEQLANRFR